jgi:hypothetical protein
MWGNEAADHRQDTIRHISKKKEICTYCDYTVFK